MDGKGFSKHEVATTPSSSRNGGDAVARSPHAATAPENFFEHLETLLKTNKDFVADDGRLLRNKVAEAATTLNAALLRLLLSDTEARKRFFADVDGTTVFDKAAFAWAVENRAFLPDSYTRFKNRIGLTDAHGDFLSSSGDVVLSFPYKDCVLEGGQTKEDQKRNEVFYNRTLAPDEIDRLLDPKAFCKAVRHDKDGAHSATSFDPVTDNLVIKGNNLLALASLLPRYEGKVKLIYIDPPDFHRAEGDASPCNRRMEGDLSWRNRAQRRAETALAGIQGHASCRVAVLQPGRTSLLPVRRNPCRRHQLERCLPTDPPGGGRHGQLGEWRLKKSSTRRRRLFVPFDARHTIWYSLFIQMEEG